MEKIEKLKDLCKSGFGIEVNHHNTFYESAEEHLSRSKESISDEVYNEMIATNTIYCVWFYPNTPIGFYNVYHYDLDKCLDRAIEISIEQQL